MVFPSNFLIYTVTKHSKIISAQLSCTFNINRIIQNLRLRTQILLIIIPLVLIQMLTLGWVAYDHLESISQQRTLNQNKVLLDQIVTNLQSEIDSVVAHTHTVSHFGLLQRYLLTTDQDTKYTLLYPSLLELFLNFQKTFSNYHAIHLFEPDGTEDIRSTLAIPADSYDKEIKFQLELFKKNKRPISITFSKNLIKGKHIMFVSKRLELGDASYLESSLEKQIGGYLLISMSLSALTQNLNIDDSNQGYLFFTNQKGEILHHQQDTKLKQHLPSHVFFELMNKQTHLNPHLVEIFDEPSYVISQKVYEGLFAFSALPQQILHDLGNHLAWIVASITLLGILLTGATLYYLMNWILVMPISQLNDATNLISTGNLTGRFNVKASGEIGELAHSFKHMCTALSTSRKKIQQIAYLDSLTGLPNRRMMDEYLDQLLDFCKNKKKCMALLLLDLDNFKWVNDSLGHQTGDELLKLVTKRLLKCLRNDCLFRDGLPTVIEDRTDFMARLGGDEFVIFLSGMADMKSTANVAQRMINQLSEPFNINKQEFFITVSIGMSLYPSDTEDKNTLFKNADLALYKAKEEGKSTYRVYTPALNEKISNQVSIEQKVRGALRRDELKLHFQPILELSTHTVVGFEALLRWKNKDALMAPELFIPIMEETGVIIPVGEWILKQVCEELEKLMSCSSVVPFIAINISSVQLLRSNYLQMLKRVTQSYSIDLKHLHLEITESRFMDLDSKAIKTLQDIRKLGIVISLDDFGTGYSSLARLKNLPIDTLKVDRSFIRNICKSNSQDAAIVSAIICMGHSLELSVLIEGVENYSQLKLVRNMGCDFVQGFLIGKPSTSFPIELVKNGLHRPLSENSWLSIV